MGTFDQSITFYYIASSLKDVLRQGPLQWRVKREIKETDAAHIYGTLMLAIALQSERKYVINFEKAFFMLAVHELEEIIIGDVTPLDHVPTKQKHELGNKAAWRILSVLQDKQTYYALIEEFNEGKTPEAHFAQACDKLECVLEFKKYVDAGQTSLANITPQMLQNKKLEQFYKAGVYDLADIFYLYHMKPFEDLGFTETAWFEDIKKVSSTPKVS